MCLHTCTHARGDASQDDEDGDDGDRAERQRANETPLDLKEMVQKRLAQPAVIHFCCQLLACYKQVGRGGVGGWAPRGAVRAC